MSYLQKHLKVAIEELIERLLEESSTMIMTHDNIPEDEYKKYQEALEESSDTVPEIPDKFLVDKNKRIKKTLSKIETNMRKRINPLKERGRPKKSKEKRNLERAKEKQRLQAVLRKLISDNERLSKVATAKLLGVGVVKIEVNQ